MNYSRPGESKDEKLNRFLDTLSNYFYAKHNIVEIDYTIEPLRDLSQQVRKLNENIEKADRSSVSLSKSLNELTFWGVIIAGTGIIVTLLQFLFENNIWPFIQ